MANIWEKNITRVITGLILGFGVLFVMILGGLPLLLLVLTVLILGCKEYIKIFESRGFYPQKFVLIIACACFLYIVAIQRFDLMQLVLTIATIFVFLDIIFRLRKPYIANISSTILGIIYCGWLPCHVILLRNLGVENVNFFKFNDCIGLGLSVFLLLACVATDVGGWYFGCNYGKHPLCPQISPKKTYEGAIYGTLFAVIICTITGLFLPIPLWCAILGGFLISIFAQFGDLSESLLKRDAGMKDSGQILPGHGGFLDRADGYIFAAPIAYYYFNFFVLSHQEIVEPIISFNSIKSLFGI